MNSCAVDQLKLSIDSGTAKLSKIEDVNSCCKGTKLEFRKDIVDTLIFSIACYLPHSYH
jgi:hypothetical protein